MCFAPQRCAIFHRNFQKWSDVEVFLTFWLPNRATAACHFWSLIWPDGSAALASLLFNPGAQNIGKTLCFATFLHFRAPASSFFWLFLFSELVSSAFLFSDSCHLSFSICPYCRKFWPLNFLRYIYIYISPEKLPSCSPADLHLRIHVISSIHDEFHLVDWHPRKSHGHRFSARRPTSKPRGRPYDNPQEIEAVTSHQMLLHKRIKDHASDQLCLKPRETS